MKRKKWYERIGLTKEEWEHVTVFLMCMTKTNAIKYIKGHARPGLFYCSLCHSIHRKLNTARKGK